MAERAFQHPLAVNHDFIAVHRNDGDPVARNGGALQHFHAVCLDPVDHGHHDLAPLHHLGALGELFDDGPIGQEVQVPLGLVLDPEVFGHPDLFTLHPVGAAAPGQVIPPLRAHLGVGVEPFELFLCHVLKDKGPFGVRPIGLGRIGVEHDHERVEDRLDLDVLFEALGVGVFRDHAHIPEATANGAGSGPVIGHVRVGVVLNVPDQPLEHLRGLRVRLVVHGVDVDRGAVLANVVGDLPLELGQSVDRQAWLLLGLAPALDVGGPLVTSPEVDVLQGLVPGFGRSLHPQLEPLPHDLQELRFPIFGLRVLVCHPLAPERGR